MLVNSYFIEFDKLGKVFFNLFFIVSFPTVLIYLFDVEKIHKKIYNLFRNNEKNRKKINESFSHQGNKVAFFSGMQKAMQNKENRKKLSNPDLTKQQKDEIYKEIAINVAKELGIKPNKVATISTDKKRL
jgi:biopolymer transport protein ExbB/TolQ